MAQESTGPTHGGLTVAALLEEPLLRGAALLHPLGGPALGAVTWALPLAQALVDKSSLDGVLVHLSAIESADLSSESAASLSRRGAVGLIVTSDGTPILPRHLPDTLAIVRMTAAVSFHQLNRLVAEKVLSYQTHVLEYGMRVHRTMSELLYRGAGLAAMAGQLSRLSGCPVFLLDTHLSIVAYESLAPGAVPDPSEVQRLMTQTLSAGPTSNPSSAAHPAMKVELVLEQGPLTCVVAPILLGRTTYGWVVIVELQNPAPVHDLAQHRVIAEHGATIVGSEMLRLRSVFEAEERARGDFVHALLHARFSGPQELAGRAAHHHFNAEAAHGVLVAGGSPGATPIGLEQQANLVRWARQSLCPDGRPTFATSIGDLLVLVHQLPSLTTTVDVRQQSEVLAQFAHELDRSLRARLGPTIRIAFGRPAPSAGGISSSYRDARIALGVSERLHLARVCGYSELRVFATLTELAGSPAGREFAFEVLGPLRKGSNSDDLESVVLAYVEAGGNLNAAAREVQMHRNTVLYKLNRASRLLNMDLRVADSQFTLWLAHRLDLLGAIERSVGEEVDPRRT